MAVKAGETVVAETEEVLVVSGLVVAVGVTARLRTLEGCNNGGREEGR